MCHTPFMKHLLPTNVELLVELAASNDLEYEDAYFVWKRFYTRADAYMIVETVLYIAKTQRLSINLALTSFKMWFGTSLETAEKHTFAHI